MFLKFLKRSLERKRTVAELNELALAHHARGELDMAEQYFRKVVLQNPSEVSAWTNLALTIISQQKFAVAVPVLLEIIELQPDLAEAHLDLGVCYNRLKNNVEAVRHYRTGIALKPALGAAHANIINAHLDCCDWDEVDRWKAEFLRYKEGRPVQDWAERLEPFCAFSLFPAAIIRELASCRAAKLETSIGATTPRLIAAKPASRGRNRIRVGYVSSNFYSHPSAHLTFGLYEAHNRQDFEVYAYSSGPDDGSVYRKHIEQTCDRFSDIRFESLQLTAQRIEADDIDILVEMNGHAAYSRLQLFAYRPARVRTHYLGYPSTTGASFIDYFISDHIATPSGCEDEFTEKLVYMPNSYQINDSRQPIAARPVVRSEFGLSENAFVYGCFNTLRKIDRTLFSVWMEILRAVPGSVLWLIKEDPQAEINLRQEARSRNVDPDRLVFAEKVNKATHLARHRLADLFLDTYICNGHTTTSDVLWAGVPVLTCPGTTFARRVSASLLNAVDLRELIAQDLKEYESMAIGLARDRELLSRLRNRLDSRATSPLFDTSSQVRHLETAYRAMLDTYYSGRAPYSFSVARA